ncbi:AMP-binding protein [Idiomarina xiamenensis]|uniref:Long-chain acyl-CoA synthetase-like protein n=1 Tax=Idiomarina xiamenensis 10-D-4 TaxID=740709 RepID=K2KPB4_9GAMM|nr:AMP-binding protein [Idiomarina xiamenensis]EKE84209.1 long-chain acyl-CoA synthetase-like protein [Idiomarina xiamenensis 10-D-4]
MLTQLLHDRLRTWARSKPSQIALRDSQQQLSYQALWELLSQLAERFNQEPRYRLGLLASNSVQWVLIDLAATMAGRTVVPIPSFFTVAQQQALMQDADIDLLITDVASVDLLLNEQWPTAQRWSNLPGFQVYRRDYPSIASAAAKITYTSGSSAAPKGVCLADAQLQRVLVSIASIVPSQLAQRHLVTMPLAVLLENIAGVWLALYLGAEVVLPSQAELGLQGSSQLNLQQFIGCLRQHRPESLICTPQIAQVLIAATAQQQLQASDFRFIAVGGAAIATHLLQQAQALGLPLYQGYGLSECASVVALNAPGQSRLGSVGRPLPHCQVRIDDEGQIWVSGNVMQGYLNQPVAPEWWSTGDLGRLDDDGYLYVQGRCSSLLITGYGRNVSPEWIESEAASFQQWRQLLVAGDGQVGLMALITPAAGASEVDIEQALALLNRRLPDYARLIGWLATAEPFTLENGLLTSNGRIRRKAILQQYQPVIDDFYQRLSDSQGALSSRLDEASLSR